MKSGLRMEYKRLLALDCNDKPLWIQSGDAYLIDPNYPDHDSLIGEPAVDGNLQPTVIHKFVPVLVVVVDEECKR